MNEISRHNKKDDCWVVVDSCVYDITNYVKLHPGGEKMIMLGAGKDATQWYHKFHGYVSHKRLLQDNLIGYCKF